MAVVELSDQNNSSPRLLPAPAGPIVAGIIGFPLVIPFAFWVLMKSRFARQGSVRLFWAACLLLIAGARLPAADNAAVSEERLRQDVTYLASDALEGRGVGTAGLD